MLSTKFETPQPSISYHTFTCLPESTCFLSSGVVLRPSPLLSFHLGRRGVSTPKGILAWNEKLSLPPLLPVLSCRPRVGSALSREKDQQSSITRMAHSTRPPSARCSPLFPTAPIFHVKLSAGFLVPPPLSRSLSRSLGLFIPSLPRSPYARCAVVYP